MVNVSVPPPSLMKPADPIVIVPGTVMLPLPPKVTPILVGELIALVALSVRVPASLLILVTGVSVVMVPPQVLLPLILRSAPIELTPNPLMVSGNALTVIPPCSCSVALLATVVLILLPNALLCCILITPASILVAPV